MPMSADEAICIISNHKCEEYAPPDSDLYNARKAIYAAFKLRDLLKRVLGEEGSA